MESDPTGARATKFVVTYECMPILMRIMEKYKERPLLSGVLCGCVAHAATAPECFPMLCTEDVLENLVAAFAKHVVPDNFSDTSVNRMQFTRLLVAPLANLTAEQYDDEARLCQGKLIRMAMPPVVKCLALHASHPRIMMMCLQ